MGFFDLNSRLLESKNIFYGKIEREKNVRILKIICCKEEKISETMVS